MNYKLIDKIQVKLEHILESDPRTFKNPTCEYGYIFDSVYDVLKLVKKIEKTKDN